jgi:hypothetical protein
MVPAEKLKSIRKKYEAKVYELFDDLDESGFNSETYRESFSKMSDKDFIQMCKNFMTQDDMIFSIDTNQMESAKEGKITLDKIKKVADKHKIRLVEYVFMPFRNTKEEPMCTLTRVPIVYCQIRRFFQQMLQHKNSISNNNSKINPLTGQVINEDKTASTTNIQTYSLTITNREAALKEYLGPRADDTVAKQQMLTQIEQTGRFRLEDTIMQTHNRQSVNTAETFAKAAGVVMEFAGNDYKIDLDNL